MNQIAETTFQNLAGLAKGDTQNLPGLLV
jgi:hypothetical protein